MNKVVELLVNFINTKIEQSLQDFKKEISTIPVPEQSVSADEMQRILEVLEESGKPDGVHLSGALSRLGGIEEEWSGITDQISLIESFLKICGDFCDYNGFFVFKNGGANCYDATPHNLFPQKGISLPVSRFDACVPVSESSLPDDVKQVFSGISDVYVLPLKLKFRPAGFVLTVLSEPDLLDFMKTMVAMMSRELTLLPHKAKAHQEPVKPAPKQPTAQVSGTSSRASISSIGMESPLERAIRYAKLLASEIKLYNEKAVTEGLRVGGLRELLDTDIQRSYHSFREKFPNTDEIPDRIFDEALIEYVADGNADLM